MLEKRRLSVTEIIRSLRTFLSLFVPAAVLFAIIFKEDYLGSALRMLPLSLVFLFAGVVVSRLKNIVLILASFVLMLAACVLWGRNLAEYGAFFVTGAVACGFGYIERTHDDENRRSVVYAVLIIIAFTVLYTIQRIMLGDYAGNLIFSVTLIYGILYAAEAFLNRIDIADRKFSGKTAQPIGLIKKNARRITLLTITVLLVAALFVPADGVAPLVVLFEKLLGLVIYLILSIISAIMSLIMPEGGKYMRPEPLELPEFENATGDTTFVLIVAALIALAAAYLIIRYLVIPLLRKLVGFISSRFIPKQVAPLLEEQGIYDVVEVLSDVGGKQAKVRDKEKGSSAQEIRRIYRKRVTTLAKRGMPLSKYDTTKEISRSAQDKGENIEELTKLYEMARYSRGCTDADVEAAKTAAKARK